MVLAMVLAMVLVTALAAVAGAGDAGAAPQSAQSAQSARRAQVALTAGAVRFGALFAVHAAPLAGAGSGRCGAVREHYGIQRVEAALQALDAVNAAPLLRGVRLGAELRDSCWAPPTALRQTVELVRHSLLAAHVDDDDGDGADSCPSDPGDGGDGDGEGQQATPLLGVLGPGASAAAAHVQNLLQLFNIPQVSYSATSRELSDRARFATFFRVVPSDAHQARLLAALLRAHNWTYVHALHTDDSYGVSGMAAFRAEAGRVGVCVARAEALRAQPDERDVDAALECMAGGASRVALCWCEGRTARAVLAALARRARRAPSEAPLRLVASDGWADRRDVVDGLEAAAARALTVRIRSPYLTHFDAYYHALDPRTNSRDPWFREFWEQKFACSLEEAPAAGRRRCAGDESLAVGYTQEPKLALVVRGVWALAHALGDMLAAECGGEGAGCAALRPLNVSLYRRYLERVRFVAPDGGTVAFDENGDPPPESSEYDVMSWELGPRGWGYARVGRWRGGRLRLRGGRGAAARRGAGVSASCGRPCGPGEWALRERGRTGRCCWRCRACGAGAVPKRDGGGCRRCPAGSRPDASLGRCRPSPLEWPAGESAARAAAATAGAGGLVATALCAAVLWRHRRTPVVKSASRELCALLLAAAALCHAAALCAASRPSAAACAGARLGAPALGGVYAAVLARTVRVQRLVAAAATGQRGRPRLLSSRAQVAAWLALSSPGALLALWAGLRRPPTPRVLHPTPARSVLACGGERARAHLGPLAPALALLALCVLGAWRTRRLPHNLRETRWIGAAAYATGVAWALAGPLHAALPARSQALAALVSLSASACVTLTLGPRVWVCLLRPRRNTRAHFLTTSLRCHVGRYRAAPPAAAPPRRPAATQTPPSPPPSPCPLPPCARVRRLTAAPD